MADARFSLSSQDSYPAIKSNTFHSFSYEMSRRFVSFAQFADQDEAHYGLNGSATQMERIFPPEKNTEKHTITGNAGEQANGIFALLQNQKLL